MKRLRYIFPEMTDFREARPGLCWEHMYGWLDGYGLLFDPVVFARTQTIPEWENGWRHRAAPGDFIIAPCAQASAAVGDLTLPGVYVRPSGIPGIGQRDRRSEKDVLTTPAGPISYPVDYLYDTYAGPGGRWMLGERPAVRTVGRAVAVAVEFFAMVGAYRSEIPEDVYLLGAEMLGDLLGECGVARPAKGGTADRERRLDFQAYGLNRLLMQWFLELKGRSRTDVAAADEAFLKAMAACRAGRNGEARRELGQAFARLAELRQSLSPMDVAFLEYPHLGILFEDKGFFELEWPSGTRDMLLSYVEQVERRGYKVSLEAGASCWENLVERYPRLGATLAALWRDGKIELTNGTYTLPYALLSPLALQYRQFEKGVETFEQVFGKRPEVYQCQENSFTAQMPELLRHFGYRRALHIVQNRGEAPAEDTGFITWTSPAGHGLRAMTTRHPALARKGCNYFLDLPLVHDEYGAKETSLNYVNFQDIGYVPFRVHMIRAHHYAPVWGRFALDRERFRELEGADAPVRTYQADAYKLSAKFFYPSVTNVNPFSHGEQIYALSGWLRQLRLAGPAGASRLEFRGALDRALDALCLMEAHDCSYCQGQYRGEFYARNSRQISPFARDPLTRQVAQLAATAGRELQQAAALLRGRRRTSTLFNASEVSLAFARVREPEDAAAAGLVRRGPACYALGPFPAFAARSPRVRRGPAGTCRLPCVIGRWRIAVGRQGQLVLARAGQSVTCRPLDRTLGYFAKVSATLERQGGMVFLTVRYQREDAQLQAAVLDVVFAEDGDYAEINVTYAPRTNFEIVRKWDDCLALEWQVGAGLDKVWRFNPNVRSLTHEDRTVSPYYLGVDTADGGSLSLMNAGAMLYELERERGVIRWLFHVQGESVFTRRMGVVFGRSEVFQLARAWNQGLLTLNPGVLPLLARTDWRGVSVEDWVAPDTLLVSNLGDGVRRLTTPRRAYRKAVNLLGQRVGRGDQVILKPMELALLKL
ncbi:MAG: hypothetical protein K8T26_06330 [Lentisphaerae bacterium]|nr:hypothetical protein [Lentisphaerota bacterium]